MTNSYKEYEKEGRLERENRDMDDSVIVGGWKNKTYHEMDEDGNIKCMVSYTSEKKQKEVSRETAINWHNFPCFQRGCKADIDGED